MPSIRRDLGVDRLRALAIVLVLGLHFFSFRAAIFDIPRHTGPWFDHVFGHGYAGVTIFFVVSGYLITRTGLSVENGRVNVRAGRFYLRRITRILPLLTVVLLAATVFRLASAASPAHTSIFSEQGAPFTAAFWVSIATFSFNWFRILFGGHAGGWGMQWDILWSLAVEEQFYLMFPLVMPWLGTVKRVRIAMYAVVAVATLVRALLLGRGDEWNDVFCNSFTCFDALAIGVLAALPPARPLRWARAVTAIAVVALFGGYVGGRVGFGLSVLTMALATAALIRSGQPDVDRIPGNGLVASFGRLSYGLYLLHPMVLFVIAPVVLALPPLVGFSVFVLASAVVAKASFILFEMPVERALRIRLLGPQAAAPRLAMPPS